jgi:hypothetical protein
VELMGVLFAFLVGWVMGSRGGEQSYDEVVAAFKEVRESDEFATLLGALRTHTGHMLRQAADWLEDAEARVPETTDLIERVRGLVNSRRTEEDPDA